MATNQAKLSKPQVDFMWVAGQGENSSASSKAGHAFIPHAEEILADPQVFRHSNWVTQ